ncbi:hypothetical protein B0H21DRAFT_255586 [Amylocystis lapponica]|nr:hypothetical protein B0H21DRAFT_255586 [Amylocystis lapponica]
MSAQALQEDQLLELLLQLKKTTPDQARIILQTQPQIAVAVMAVMVNINAVNMEVVQRTLATYGASSSVQPPAPALSSVPTPAPAIPPHLIPQAPRGTTPTYPPQLQPPAYPQAAYPPHAGPSHAPYGAQPAPVHGYSTHQPPPVPTSIIPDALASIPDEQKALIMRVISMTREEIYQLPYSERDNIIKLRATLGLPT